MELESNSNIDSNTNDGTNTNISQKSTNQNHALMSYKEIFVEKYVEYVCAMTHVSKITKFNNQFYQLILFLHEGSEKHDTIFSTHKIRQNCLFVNKIFDNTFTFNDHGLECNLYTRYVSEYCPDEVQIDTMIGHSQQQTFYGCDFECPSTFQLIADRLKSLGITKDKLIEQQQNLEKSKYTDPPEVFNEKVRQFKQYMILTKNVCTFIAATKNAK